MVTFLKAYTNPNKYAKNILTKEIVADTKVDFKGVNRVISEIESGKSLKAIVIVKHPKKNYYAVLDGHHRFWAQKILGFNKIKCAVIEDFFGIGFHLTKNGIFQPDPKITKYIRIPLKRIYVYITEFINEPEKIIVKMNNIKKKLINYENNF
jgi:hypothetical protein